MRFSVCDMKSTITGWPLAAAHGNLTPAHTDECAAQCFEGVQRGSIIVLPVRRRPQVATLVLQPGLIAPLFPTGKPHGAPAARLGTDRMCPFAL